MRKQPTRTSERNLAPETNEHANAVSVHPAAAAIMEGATAYAADRAMRIRFLMQYLAETMQEIHGGAWRSTVDHEVGLVMIFLDSRRENSPRPPLREAV